MPDDKREYDAQRLLVLVGLTHAETREFDALDAERPIDKQGQIAWQFEGSPQTLHEHRWLELFEKHQREIEARRRTHSLI
jgi:hypothetical protein